ALATISICPIFLVNPDLQLIIFGGKGGTGKTTAAAATAIHLAHTNKKILIVSTDPAHSLSDSFEVALDSHITAIAGRENLWAWELNAQQSYDTFMEEHGEVLKKIADRGTYFDHQDINEFFSLSLPGLDEMMAIIEIANLLKNGRYDVIILDTAPTGHTLRMLALPHQMDKWIEILDMMEAKHRYLMRHFTGRYVKDEVDAFVEMVTKDVGRVRSLLRDPRVTEFVPVTIPESLSIYETERLLDSLRQYKIPVKSIVVNRVLTEGECLLCLSRWREREKYLAQIDETFASYHLVHVPLFPHEIRGIRDLSAYAACLFEEKPRHDTPAPPSRFVPAITPCRPPRTPGLFAGLLEQDLEFLIFGGKGGVGKTSMTAAMALRMAKHHPGKKILVFSTDPAHSLSDSFGCRIGDEITTIEAEGCLEALEIDPTKIFEDFKVEFQEEMKGIFDKFLGRRVDIKFDRQVMTELVDLSPPGLDEIMALRKIADLSDKQEYDMYILDTAPTGHLLRFLELPELVRDWLKTFFRIILKYKDVFRMTRPAERLVDLSRSVRRVQEILTDPQRTEFVAVTIPEAMGILELGRLLSSLRTLKIPCRHVVVNMVTPPTDCHFCAVKRQEQHRYIAEVLEKYAADYLVTQVPLFPQEVKGGEALRELSEWMYGLSPGEIGEAELTPRLTAISER
ncbi:MAG: TRC40/GET3/ArsA family transport-energizing ATPase, partial [Candidatus Binatia bacterium]